MKRFKIGSIAVLLGLLSAVAASAQDAAPATPATQIATLQARLEAFESFDSQIAVLEKAVGETRSKYDYDYQGRGLVSVRLLGSWKDACGAMGDLKTGAAAYGRAYYQLSSENQRLLGDLDALTVANRVEAVANQCMLPRWSLRGPSKSARNFAQAVESLAAVDDQITVKIIPALESQLRVAERASEEAARTGSQSTQ